MKAFNQLYQQHYSTVFRVALKMLGDSDEAADIGQEVFLTLFQTMEKSVDVEYPKSWLYRMTLNKCIDKQKYNGRFLQLDSAPEERVEDQTIEKQEARLSVQQALAKLKPEERALAVMYSESLSYKEMAEATGIRFSSIGKTLSRTLKKLEAELKTKKYELY